MTTVLPPQPAFRSIFGGIALVAISILAFLNIDKIVKFTGAILTFIPSKLGLIQVVFRDEVMPVDMHSTPTSLTFTNPGRILLYTDNYDLLVINDAILAAKAKPWINILSDSGEPVQVRLIERGMAFYDTPLARGRPVASFEIAYPGDYTMMHPRRPINAYIVPDYTSGNEGTTSFIMWLEIGIVVVVILNFTRRRHTKKILIATSSNPGFSHQFAF